MNANEIRPEWLEDMDCVILGGYFEDSHILDALTQDILSFGIIPSENWVPNLTIDSDNQQMGALAAKRLIELGTRSPCLIAYSNLDQRHVLRKLGFQVKWVESGGSLSDIQEHWIDPENTYKKVVELERIVRSLEDRDSLFCLEKESAIDVLNIFEHLNVKVPDRVKVISSDGTFESLTTHPKLTYVKQHFEEMALIAAENIRLLCLDYQDIQSEVPRGQKILVPPELVIHDSA